VVIFFFFQKKKQKALFRFAEDAIRSKGAVFSPNLGEADPECLGAGPKKPTYQCTFETLYSSFSRKRSKKRCSASRKTQFV
jgi:hypothetical protein